MKKNRLKFKIRHDHRGIDINDPGWIEKRKAKKELAAIQAGIAAAKYCRLRKLAAILKT